MAVAHRKVLIVDDEESIRDLLVHALGGAGYETRAVGSANEAIAHLRSGEEWDLILTDLRMPGMPGETLLERVDREFPTVATVVMTGYPSSESVRRAANARACDYIEKPFKSLDSVIQRIGQVLAERRQAEDGGAGNGSAERIRDLERQNRLLARRLEFTQRNLSEQFRALRRSREFFYNDLSRVMSIFDNLGDGIVCTDGEGKVILVNPAAGRMLEVPPFASIGKRLSELRANPHLRDILSVHREGDLGEDGVEAAIATTPTNSKERFFTVATRSVQDLRGDRSGVLSLIRDVSLRKKTELLKNQFLSIVAHELRTPLTSIKAFATIMDKGLQGDLPEALRPLLTHILSQVERLGHEIDKIISLGLLQGGDYDPDLQEVQARKIIRNVILPFAGEAERKGVDLVLTDETGDAMVEADVHNIRRALRALVENSVKFTPQSGKVEMRATATQEEVTFEVRDTGIGIEPKDHAVIFEQFTQLENPLTRQHGGSGLGLCFASGIIDAHGSTIEVESALGRGAVFCFRLARV